MKICKNYRKVWNMEREIKNSFLTAYETIKNFVENEENILKTAQISKELAEAYNKGKK